MMSTVRWWLLLQSGIVAGLFVGISACTAEVEEPTVTIHQRDTEAQARKAALTSDQALAEQGDADAQARLGHAYYAGDGTAQDFEQAVRWAQLAAEQGNPLGQGVLAAAFNTGNGVAQDFGEAARWARLAAEQGDARGQTVLGSAYRNGRGGVELDYEEAVHWTRLAAEQGDASAQAFLGMMYVAGQGVERDYVSAYMWLTLGASAPGIGGAREMLDTFLAKQMTPEEIAEAEARARDRRQ